MSDDTPMPIALTGMACRLPGADTVDEFWRTVRDGTEQVRRFTAGELVAAGNDPALVDDPDYVPAAAVIDGADRFDAGFFGLTPGEAEQLDPQHRVFLECAWSALEDAGHDTARFTGSVGMYAGCFMNKYLSANLLTNPRFLRSPAAYYARNFNDKDFLAARAAYLLNLTGPALTVQTACSTSLVATHLAVQALLAYECDMALVGGVCLHVPLHTGYLAHEGGLLSPGGHCRPFDASADGTIPGYGCGVVVLRRLDDALRDRDHIRATIRGTAVNNNGAGAISFTAPSVDGQLAVIATAQAVAGTPPETIGYVEAHGTGTPLGDPIEVAALTEAFRAGTDRVGFCALGSAKANLGHLDAAAGVVGLMRAALALEHGRIPPLANLDTPNPELKLDTSPFYLPRTARDWPAAGHPRRAAVSSFGVGGTNAHVVLEQAPAVEPAGPDRDWQLLPVSGVDTGAVAEAMRRLADHLDAGDTRLADAAYTLQAGRRHFAERGFVVAGNRAAAVAALRAPGAARTVRCAPGERQVVFAYPGGGSQHPGMAAEAYRAEPVFAAAVDECADLLAPRLDLRAALLSGQTQEHPSAVLAGIFAVEWALTRLWESWGVRPRAVLGHSLGEYAAACAAGVFTLAEALDLTVLRGDLFARMPPGRMLSVALAERPLRERLGPDVDVAAVNAPGMTLVSGPREAIAELAARLAADGVDARPVPIDVASHSAMVEPFLDELTARVGRYRLGTPAVPVLSGVTGTWLRAEDATDPAYWARHLRRPVRFADCVREAVRGPGRVVLEVGPGQTLTSLVRAQGLTPVPVAVSSLPRAQDGGSDLAHLVGAVGRLWQAGVDVDWAALHGPARPRRTPLPAYPFQRRRHWIPAGGRPPATAADGDGPGALPADGDGPRALSTDGDGPRAHSADGDGRGARSADGDRRGDRGPVADAPRGDRERRLAGLWRDLLGVPHVGRNDDFGALGGHSFLAMQLGRRIRTDLGVTVTVRDLFAHPTVAELAGLLAERARGGTADRPDLIAEARLDPAITADHVPPATGPVTDVFLTGATGFLGAHLCAELLRRTTATVHCLVRADDPRGAAERLRAALDRSGLGGAAEAAGERLVAVPGDLSRERLGLTGAAFTELAERTGLIVHCGAWVNFVRPYRALRDTNVLGTQEVLRMAATGRRTPVHHVSTLAVLAGALAGGVPGTIGEDGPLPPPVGHDTAYSESKWVGEQLVWEAGRRGVPVAVHRPGVVLGATTTGVSNPDDYYTRLVQGCVRLGLAPARSFPQHGGPVDAVARQIVTIALRPDSPGRAFHNIAEQPLAWDRIFELVRDAGYRLDRVPFTRWRTALDERLETDPDPALATLGSLLTAAPDREMPAFATANAREFGGADLPSRRLDDPRYFDTLLGFFAGQGWIPQRPVSDQEAS